MTTPRADELVVNWPDPSPLHDWWAEVMTGKAGTDRVADAA
ncbi:hypothetical protein [Nocardia sp. alder85J]|nr:hypothetical protein [Nocardia sp. alder85J]MCX4092950.1 hypothetical protein [Nocardia sp. alder85J]